MGTAGAAPNAANTQPACDAACLADTTCLGYDFTTSGTGTLCWIHTNADFIANAAASTSSDQYRRQPCGRYLDPGLPRSWSNGAGTSVMV